MIITDIKQGVKNPNRVNVFVDGKFSFSLDIAQVVDFGVKIGRELDEDKILELKRASELGKLYQRALEWVLVRPRSEREVRDYLVRKLRNVSRGGLSDNRSERSEASPVTAGGRERLRVRYSEFSEEILERLVARGYVDDRRFAEFWVENRFVKKGVSRKRLLMELTKKGVAREIIEEVIAGRSDEEELRKMIQRKRTKYNEPEKLMAYLVRQGFSYDLVRKMIADEKD